MLLASLVSFLLDRIQHLPANVVYLVVFALVFGEAALFIGFVLPGETAVLVAGAAATSGHGTNIKLLCVIVVVAAIGGDSVGYLVGKRYGHRLFQLPLIRNRHAALERALEQLRIRGPLYVFIGRFTAFLRAVMPGLAGMSRMRYRSFFLANTLGGLTWGLGFTLLGYFAGHALHTVEKYASWAGISILVLAIIFFIWHHRRTVRREAREENEWTKDHPEQAPES